MHRRILFCLLVLFCARLQAAVIYINQSSAPANILSVNTVTGTTGIVLPGANEYAAGRAIAVNSVDGSIFFSSTSGVFLSSMSGSPLVAIDIPSSITGVGRIVDIEVDHALGKAFYIDDSGNVLQSDLAGSNISLLRQGGDVRSDGIALDANAGLLYFNAITYDTTSALFRHVIRSMTLDGTQEKLFTDIGLVSAFASGGSSADIEVNSETGAVYVSDRFSASVYAFANNGLLDKTLFAGGINDLWGPMAFDSLTESLLLTAPEINGENGQLWSIGVLDGTVKTIVGKSVSGLNYGFYGVDVGSNPRAIAFESHNG